MPSDALVHPDTRAALFDLIDGSVHVDHTVTAAYQETATPAGLPKGPFPLVVIYSNGGTQGHIDRTDRLVLECFAEGELSMRVLESIHASVCGWDIETPSGYLDTVSSDQTPAELPYPSETLNKSTCRLLVTTRPIE